MTNSYSAPKRTLPANPNLEQLRKQAKELLKSYRDGDAKAVAEVDLFERKPDAATFALADAQRVLARAYGFESWARLKQQVAGLTNEAFIAAAAAGDVAEVRRLVKARPDLIHVELAEFGDSALHRAVMRRDVEMTRILMQLGADARGGIWPHRDATSPYTIAKERRYEDVVLVIEEEEARRRDALSSGETTTSSDWYHIRQTFRTDAPKNTQIDDLLAAIRRRDGEEAIRILQSDPALVKSCDVYGATPLHAAAATHDSETVAWLIDHGAAVDAKDAERKTPLDYAAVTAGWSANDHYYPYLSNARIDPARFDDVVRLLRSHGAELTLRSAVAIGDREAVLKMHGEGRLKNEINFWGGGLLTIAARVNRIEMVSLLLDLGLDPDEAAQPTEDGGRSWGFPLWFAAVCGRHAIAELLLTRGADPSAIFAASGDPLGCVDETGDAKMKELLLKYGARITVERLVGAGDTASLKAILDGAIPGHSLNTNDSSPAALAAQMLWMAALGGNAEIVQMCLPYVTLAKNDLWWNYVLIHVSSSAVLKLLMEHGVDPNVAANRGYTILHHLATKHCAGDIERVELAAIVLDAGASLDLRDLFLKSKPLGWACRWGRRELVELYLARGADPRELDSEQWSRPLAWAEEGGHQDIVALLKLRGA